MPRYIQPKMIASYHMLPFFGEYLHAKNQRYSRIPTIDIDDQRIMQSDWMRALLAYNLWGRIFTKYGICTGKLENAKSFILGYFQQKVMKKNYEKTTKLHFGHFLLFSGNTIFSEKSTSVIIFCFETDPWMDRSMNKHEFIGPPLPGVQKGLVTLQ